MIDSLTQVVTFERHPASIERHAEPAVVPPQGFDGITTWSPYYLPDEDEPPASIPEPLPLLQALNGQDAPTDGPPPAPGYPAAFDTHSEPIVAAPVSPTGSPHYLPDEGGPPASVTEPPPLPQAVDDRDALLDNPPLPVTVHPVAVDPYPEPIVATPVGPALETAPESLVALPEPIPPPDLPAPSATSPVSTGPATPRPLFAGYRPAAPVDGPPLGRAPDGVVADFSSAALSRPSLSDDEAMLSLWEGMSVAKPAARPVRPPASTRSRLAAGLALTALLAGAVFATLRYGPALLVSNQAITAVFNAPMMVVRAAASGRVVSVAATAAQIVDPQSPLLTIHTDDGKEDRPVFAGVHGMIRSVETVPGAALVSGAPLVRLQDCDRSFLTVPAGTRLKAGQTVQVKLSDQTVPGRVRNSAGVMEPPDSLVVGLEPGTMTAACPVGRSAAVTPVES